MTNVDYTRTQSGTQKGVWTIKAHQIPVPLTEDVKLEITDLPFHAGETKEILVWQQIHPDPSS